MGAGANVNAFFGIMTMIIAIPTGVKIFNWIFTMYRGKVVFGLPMYWLFGFLFTFHNWWGYRRLVSHARRRFPNA